MQDDNDELLTSAQAAQLLKTKEGTLAAWRHRKVGPPWIQVSDRMPRYSKRALAAWLDARVVKPEPIG